MTNGDQPNYFVHQLLRARDWQHRPELDRVCDWWRARGRGVCALVGMGGAGKTAIAERFLRMLPGGLPEDPDVEKDRSLPPPTSTFVFSFYDAPNPEAFFECLQMWLEHTARVESVLSVGQLMFLLQRTPGLIVLDGLEKVQETGSRGVFGRLASPKLRDFLDRLAAGYVPQLSVLVTSRFPLADLRDAHPGFFRTIAIEEIDVATGVQLLRDRGVRGTDPQLTPIVEECGRHALTVDFAGGYIKEYGNGDPATPLNLGTAEELKAAAEDEPDDDKRAVLKQGYRFARVAERYRAAMLENDEAAIALLERICLFRLGVDSERLAAIFTGANATKVSGKALAGLNAKQLQKKLDWLVRMRIVEESETPTSLKKEDSKPRTTYSIHPAVRDGFLGGIGREAAQLSHEAVRKGLEVSLGDAPGKNPSDPATLDLLEEIVHHTLEAGHVPEAWDIYWNRIGSYQNLLWRLGAYERGERICRAFAGGKSPAYVAEFARIRVEDDRIPANPATMPYLALLEGEQAVFINEWALYLKALGRLAAAAGCYELHIEMRMRQENWINASIGNQNLCDLWFLSGRLTGSARKGALGTAAEALRLAERIDDPTARSRSCAYRARAGASRGEVPAALADFRAALDFQKKAFPRYSGKPLWSGPGLWHTRLLARLLRREDAAGLTKANKEFLLEIAGPGNYDEPKCNLVLADLPGESLDLTARESLCRSARDWAVARDARDVLCWSALVKARLELVKARNPEAPAGDDSATDRSPTLKACETAIDEGLKIARDCGYGLFHVDLLLERARLRLLRGNPQAALADLRLALEDGIPLDDETGQPELLAANHEDCGYAWAIAHGLHLRGEAQLLQAAQRFGGDIFAPAKKKELPGEMNELIDEAKKNLESSMELWQPLHDPKPERPDQNFQLGGKEYNFRAAETSQILDDLKGGILTRYPLEAIAAGTAVEPTPGVDPSASTPAFDVFLSHNSKDKPAVRRLANALGKRGLRPWLDERELVAGRPWQEALEKVIETAKTAAVLVGKDGLGPWEKPEMRACLSEFVDRRMPVIPVLLPGAPKKPKLPLFLKAFAWVDLRDGLKKNGLDQLERGITNRKPE